MPCSAGLILATFCALASFSFHSSTAQAQTAPPNYRPADYKPAEIWYGPKKADPVPFPTQAFTGSTAKQAAIGATLPRTVVPPRETLPASPSPPSAPLVLEFPPTQPAAAAPASPNGYTASVPSAGPRYQYQPDGRAHSFGSPPSEQRPARSLDDSSDAEATPSLPTTSEATGNSPPPAALDESAMAEALPVNRDDEPADDAVAPRSTGEVQPVLLAVEANAGHDHGPAVQQAHAFGNAPPALLSHPGQLATQISPLSATTTPPSTASMYALAGFAAGLFFGPLLLGFYFVLLARHLSRTGGKLVRVELVDNAIKRSS